jgi:hypothetical protein
MRGDEDVEGVGLVKDLQARIHQLGADRDRHRAADQPGDERKHKIHRADVLVIGRIEKAPPPVRNPVRSLIAMRRVCHRIHCESLCLRPPFV